MLPPVAPDEMVYLQQTYCHFCLILMRKAVVTTPLLNASLSESLLI